MRIPVAAIGSGKVGNTFRLNSLPDASVSLRGSAASDLTPSRPEKER